MLEYVGTHINSNNEKDRVYRSGNKIVVASELTTNKGKEVLSECLKTLDVKLENTDEREVR